MKFFLTVYICSVVSQQCAIPPEYPKEQSNYYDCVRNGLSESYDILYQGQRHCRGAAVRQHENIKTGNTAEP